MKKRVLKWFPCARCGVGSFVELCFECFRVLRHSVLRRYLACRASTLALCLQTLSLFLTPSRFCKCLSATAAFEYSEPCEPHRYCSEVGYDRPGRHLSDVVGKNDEERQAWLLLLDPNLAIGQALLRALSYRAGFAWIPIYYTGPGERRPNFDAVDIGHVPLPMA